MTDRPMPWRVAVDRWRELRPLEAQAVDKINITLGELSVLYHLAESGDCPVFTGEIAYLHTCTPAALTGVIDRLERRGFVERTPGQDDRRQVYPMLTPAGRAFVDQLGDQRGPLPQTDEDPELAATIGIEVRRIRERLGLRQGQFAGLLKREVPGLRVEQQDVSRWELGTRTLHPATLAIIRQLGQRSHIDD